MSKRWNASDPDDRNVPGWYLLAVGGVASVIFVGLWLAARIDDHAARIERTTTTSPAPVSTIAPTPPGGPAEANDADPEPATTSTTTIAGVMVRSTAYCLSGRMANGARVHDGAVASTILPRGSRWQVTTGPFAGRSYVVEDTGAPFDIWMTDCAAARAYGVRHVVIIPG